MSSTVTHYLLRSSVREESANAGVQDLQSKPGEETRQRIARPAPTDELEHSGAHPSCRSQLSDEGLLSLICERDGEALSLLFRRYARLVRGVAYKVLQDASEADDLLQDIFLLIHRKCGMFDSARGSARFWILQMTYHQAIARRRYLNSRHFYTRVDLDDVERELVARGTGSSMLGNSSDGLLGREGLQRVGLSENQRQTLQLFFVEGHTLGEIAVKLNQTRGNVKNHYFRGLEKLRKQVFGHKFHGSSAV